MEYYSAFQTTFKEKSRALELSVLFSSLVANLCCGFGWVADSMCHLAGGPANRGQTGENFLQGDVGTEGGHP